MRTLLILLALLIGLAALAGWITYQEGSDTATLHFDKQEAREETAEAVEAIEETVDEVTDEIRERTDVHRGDVDVDPNEDDLEARAHGAREPQ
jgi:hypothetical protein